MWKSATLVALTLIAVQLRAEPELKGSASELAGYLTAVPKLVSLTGEAEVKVPADRALISLKVVTENKSLQEASRVNQEIRSRILRTLAKQGIPNERVRPSKFSSTPKYGVFREKAKSYRVENTVKISAQDEKEFQAVANLVDAIAEVRYESIEFEHSDKDGLKAKALAQAIDKAGEKKKLYEERLGVKLSPKAFQETPAVALPPLSVQRAYAKQATYSSGVANQPAFSGVGDAQADDQDMPSSFAELVYRAQVAIEYTAEGK
jgi:hypothetical protein